MNRMLIAAAVLAMSAAAIATEAQAAPAKSPYCNMPGAANQSWAEFYGCWGGPPRMRDMAMVEPVMARERGPMDVDMCKLPAAANASWAEHYGCWRPHR